MSHSKISSSRARVLFKSFAIFAVVTLIVITLAAQRPIRQIWSVSVLKSAVLVPTFDSGRAFGDVHDAMYAVDDLHAGRLATPILARRIKGSLLTQQLKILEALVFLYRDISPATPELVEAFNDTTIRMENRDCIAMLIEYGDPQIADSCGASQFLRDRKQKNFLLEMK